MEAFARRTALSSAPNRAISSSHIAVSNLVLLCWFHHHLLHEQHWSIEPLGGGHFTLNSPRGDTQILRPPLVGLALPTPLALFDTG